MNEKPQNLKIAINSLKLNETIGKFFVTQQYIGQSVFKILYPTMIIFKVTEK